LKLGQVTDDPPYVILDIHVDHLGSTRVVTDESGGGVTRHDFFPFGEEIMPMADDVTKMFTGHERDRETGLDYMLARYYGGNLGRFLSVDPAARSAKARLPQSWNRFSYASNNPLRFIDPDGESSLEFDGKANTITLIDNKGNKIGTWPAFNNVESKNPKGKWEDGTYKMKDKSAPHKHPGKTDTKTGQPSDSKQGEYGSHGIMRAEDFKESNGNTREAMGVHSGREGVTDAAGRSGEEHATKGCIRTTDDAMSEIEKTAATDPVEEITVTNNKAPVPAKTTP